mgnify:CR=1 FL=1
MVVAVGVPLVAGYLTRKTLVARKGSDWYDTVFMPKFGPTALLGLLYTIVLMFAMQGNRILSLPLDVVRIAIPMLVYFGVMFGLAFWLSRRLGFDYQTTASLSFTAAGNNFELAIAVSIGVWGVTSGQALAGVIGPLIEVPALVGLVYVSLWLRRRLDWRGQDLDRMRDRYGIGLPVAIHNDAVCLALAEHRWGAGRGKAHVLGMVVSTGVGAGLGVAGAVRYST